MTQYSKAIAAAVVLAATFAAQFGIDIDEQTQGAITDALVSLIGSVGAVVAVYLARNTPAGP